MPIYHIALMITGGLLAGLMGLGFSLQLGWRSSIRWLHHFLFFLVCLSVLVSGVLAFHAGLGWWPLLPTLALLLSMPATKAGQANHWQRALASALAFVLGSWLVW